MDDYLTTITQLGSSIIGKLSNLSGVDPNEDPEYQFSAEETMANDQEQQVGYGDFDLMSLMPEGNDEPFRPNPYGFPEASLNESQRTQELLNPDGSGVLLPVAEQLVDAAPKIATGLRDAVPQVASGIAEAAAPVMSGLSELPQDVSEGVEANGSFQGNNIYDSSEVSSAIDQQITQNAENARRLAIGIGEKTIKEGSESANIELFDMVKSASAFVGNGLEMGYESWKRLSPSTRIALIGTAAGAYAYQRGWDKTAGDVALTTAGLYGDMYGQEVQAGTQRAKAQADTDQKAMSLLAESNEADATNEDRQYNLGQLTTLLQDQFSGVFSDDEAGLSNAANSLFNEWNQITKGNKRRQAAYPLTDFLKEKQAQKELQESRNARTHFQPAAPLGSR